jgi:uncharacterized protein (TIGR03067 family)
VTTPARLCTKFILLRKVCQSHVVAAEPSNTTMNTTITALTWIAICGFATHTAMADDHENIQGAWALETMTLDGKAMPHPTVLYIFAGETLVVRPETGKEEKTTFSLEMTSKPKVLVVQHDQHSPDRTPYELDADTLKIAFTSPDEHATEVSDKGHILFTLQRKK